MSDTSQRVGGQALTPPNVVAGMTYAPTLASSPNHPTSCPPGMPVFPAAPGCVAGASAASPATSNVTGLTAAPGAVGQIVPVLPTGSILSLTTEQWDARTGGSGGLQTNARYFLAAGPAEGLLTTVEPSAPGTSSVPVGLGLSPTNMAIRISPPDLNPPNG